MTLIGFAFTARDQRSEADIHSQAINIAAGSLQVSVILIPIIVGENGFQARTLERAAREVHYLIKSFLFL